ncbi:DiGeorge syndrome critical region protein 14 [Chamberlinius hualienensis]
MELVCKDNNMEVAVNNSGTIVAGDFVFKKPLNPPPKKKRVLDEDTYTQDLEDIIERDFFPDLPKLRAQIEYQDAVDCNDVEKLRDLRLKYGSRLGTDDSVKSPATFETPVVGRSSPSHSEASSGIENEGIGDPKISKQSLSSESEDPESNSRIRNQGLDSYLGKNTSEDNASFSTIMEEANEKHRNKYRWLYDKEEEHLKYRQTSLQLPAPESADMKAITCPDTWTYTNKNYLMFIPEGAPLTEEEVQNKLLKQREISHTNTRFQKMPFNEVINRQAISAAAHVQARNREGKIGVDGKEFVAGEEPTVNGYGFLMTPSPAPGVNESPLMTWGEIDGTPFRLDGGDTPVAHTPGPSFRIPAIPTRDKLGMELAEKVGKNYRNRKQLALKTVRETLCSPSPKGSHVERLAQMSPAAQRLASCRFGIHLGSDKSLRRSYTPSPARNLPGSTPGTPGTATNSPYVIRKSSKSTHDQSTPTISITDNLLQLPKRSKAADFFSDT